LFTTYLTQTGNLDNLLAILAGTDEYFQEAQQPVPAPTSSTPPGTSPTTPPTTPTPGTPGTVAISSILNQESNATPGQVTITVTVSAASNATGPASGGTVTLTENGTTVGSATLVNGSAVIRLILPPSPVNVSPVDHTYVATYNGTADPNFNGTAQSVARRITWVDASADNDGGNDDSALGTPDNPGDGYQLV
jgi:hypothetical protein